MNKPERKKGDKQDKPWFQKWFGKDYLLVYPDRNDAEALSHIPFLEQKLELKKGDRLLDLCCGNGRYSISLARKGYRVTGQDLSFDLLVHARKKARDAGCDISFFQADMRTSLFPDSFDALIQMFTSFGYFAKDDENLQTLQNIRTNLKSGGHYLIDYLNAEFVLANLVPETSEQRKNYLIRQFRRYDPAGKRLGKKIIIEEGTNRRVYDESVRVYTLEEITSMLEHAGLQLADIYGNFDGVPYGPDSPRMIITGTRP